MNAVKLLSVLAVSLMLTSSAYAKELKIAYVELGGVFNAYQKTKDFDAALQKESADAQKQIDEKVTKIRDAQAKLALLKEDQKNKANADIETQKKELFDFQQQKRAELGKKFEDMRKEIIIEIEKVVSSFATKEGYDFILNDSSVLYAGKETNVTETVLKTLNDGYKKK